MSHGKIFLEKKIPTDSKHFYLWFQSILLSSPSSQLSYLDPSKDENSRTWVRELLEARDGDRSYGTLQACWDLGHYFEWHGKPLESLRQGRAWYDLTFKRISLATIW